MLAQHLDLAGGRRCSDFVNALGRINVAAKIFMLKNCGVAQ